MLWAPSTITANQRDVGQDCSLSAAPTTTVTRAEACASPQSEESPSSASSIVAPPTPLNRTLLCGRHQRKADQGANVKLQLSIESLPLADQQAVNNVWSIFSSSTHQRRALILQGILTMFCASELTLLTDELRTETRVDPLSWFPSEVSLKILGYLDAITLGRAAQVSRRWRDLADDDLLWRNMCAQHINHKCDKCGWGLPLMEKTRRRPQVHTMGRTPSPPLLSSPAAGTVKRTILASALGKRARSDSSSCSSSWSDLTGPTIDSPIPTSPKRTRRDDRSSSPHPTASDFPGCGNVPVPGPQGLAPLPVLARPWKEVYCERLALERNWRQNRYTVTELRGHTNGIMCLQFSESFPGCGPFAISGSYDRTARVWDVEGGKPLQILRGHTRGVRCLQFDSVKLITGSMDRTLKVWNWRTGQLIRTLQGHNAGIVSLHFNDELLVSGSADAEIKVWQVRSGECYTLRGHKGWVNAVRLWTPPKSSSSATPIPGGEEQRSVFLFSASDDTTIKLWDLRTRQCLFTYKGHVTQVQSLKLTSMTPATLLKLGKEQLPYHGPVAAPTGSPPGDDEGRGGSKVISTVPTGITSKVAAKDRADCEHRADRAEVFSFCGRPTAVYPPLVVPDVPCLHSPSASSSNRINDEFVPLAMDTTDTSDLVMGDRRRHTAQSKLPKDVQCLHRSLSDAGLVPALPTDGSLPPFYYALYGQSPTHQESVPEEEGAGEGGCQPERPVLITGSLDNTLNFFDVLTGVCVRTIFGHVEGIWGVDTDKLRIVSASHDRTVKVWDRDSGVCQSTLVGHTAAVTAVALSDDKIVSGSDDATVRVWDFSPPSYNS